MIIKINGTEIDLRPSNELVIPGIGNCLDITEDFLELMEGEANGKEKERSGSRAREICETGGRWLSRNLA